MLAPAMRPLADAIAPYEVIVDCGGGGRCCPNSLAFSLQCLGKFSGSGDALRELVVEHATQLVETDTTFVRAARSGESLSARAYLTGSILSWPRSALKGRQPTADAWLELMRMPTTWGDEGFLAMTADLFEAEIEYRAVSSSGTPGRGGVIRPSQDRSACCRLTLALLVQQHYAAIVRVSAAMPPPHPLYGGDNSEYSREGLDLCLAPTEGQPFDLRADTPPPLEQPANATLEEVSVDQILERDVTVPPERAGSVRTAGSFRTVRPVSPVQADAVLPTGNESEQVRETGEINIPSASMVVEMEGIASILAEPIDLVLTDEESEQSDGSSTAPRLEEVGSETPCCEAAPHKRTVSWAPSVVGDTHGGAMELPLHSPKRAWPGGRIVKSDPVTQFLAFVARRHACNLALTDHQQSTLDALRRRDLRSSLPKDEVILSHMVSRKPWVTPTITPSSAPVTAPLELADSSQEIVAPSQESLATPAKPFPPLSESHSQHRSESGEACDFPLTDVNEVRKLLRSSRPPTVLVAMEFSGSLRTALEKRGIAAISADFRDCEIGGMHYRGDVRDLITLKNWSAIYFFPNCYQQLRRDADCLPLKIRDGRAFWGCAMVLWCLCCASADLVVVEQPDTIVYDYHVPEGVVLHEFRTSHLGDSTDKFVRLAIRGVDAPQFDGREPKRRRARQTEQRGRSQFRYVDAEARDRARSSYASHPLTCERMAGLALLQCAPAQPLSYVTTIVAFARAWSAQGHPVPKGFDAADGQPPDQQSRAYQNVRGPGTGTPVESVQDSDERLRAGLIPESCPVEDGRGSESETDSPGGQTDSETDLGWTPATVDDLAGAPHLDVRRSGAMASLLLLVCVLGQPLVFAHVNGFTVHGFEAPSRLTRPLCMVAIQKLVQLALAPLSYAFMVGEYLGGARLFTAPLAAQPAPEIVIRTPSARRQALAIGTGFAWCTLGALQGTWVEDAAARAILSTSAFAGPTMHLADAPLGTTSKSFLFGARPATYLLPRLKPETSQNLNPLTALQSFAAADRALMAALDSARTDNLLSGWRDIITPPDLEDIPSGLLKSVDSFADDALDRVALTPPAQPIVTPWMPLPPRQEPVTGYCPHSVVDLMPPETRRRVYEWLNHSLRDMVAIRDALSAGEDPESIWRDRPLAMAVGQDELLEWARDRVWDCRPVTRAASAGCCVVADFHEPIVTHLNRDTLARRLLFYPDQTLVANLLEGVRLDADVELQSVLIPHLASLPSGFASVEKELRRLHTLGWYDFFSDFPFWPMYLNGQGATARKLEPDRYRRTTEGGGPRQPTYDLSGLRALSINEASLVWHMPQHFRRDARPEMLAWLRSRGLPAPQAEPQGPRRSKWPKELKPQLTELMRDMAILRRAAHVLDSPIYVIGDDLKDFFNQLAMASSELHKLGIVFLAQDGEVDDAPEHAPSHAGVRLVFVSEKRLGFGTHGASNIAQRFANALLDMFRDDMDEQEAAERARHTSPALTAWLAERAKVPGDPGCYRTRRHEADSSRASVRVCPQERLYAVYMFTDDPVWVVVGVERTLRALRTWRRLTDSLGLIMAIPEKRSLGSWAKWLGTLLIPMLGLVVIPRDKILRAASGIAAVLDQGTPFGTYRALCGLLEHLRGVNQQGRNVMHGLYEPHGPTGASQHGPAGWVTCSDLMRKQLLRWLTLLGSSCGAHVRTAILRTELPPASTTYFHLCSDAMYEKDQAGLGGYCHGSYWHYSVPESLIPYLSIPILEFLGVVFNLIVFAPALRRLLQGNPAAVIVLRTDALTTALTLPAESQRSPLLMTAYQWLRERPEFTELAPHIMITHIFGDANPYSDCLSRQRWDEFFARCRQIGVKPVCEDLPSSVHEVFSLIAERAQTLGLRAGADADPSTVPGWTPGQPGGEAMLQWCRCPAAARARIDVGPATQTPHLLCWHRVEGGGRCSDCTPLGGPLISTSAPTSDAASPLLISANRVASLTCRCLCPTCAIGRKPVPSARWRWHPEVDASNEAIADCPDDEVTCAPDAMWDAPPVSEMSNLLPAPQEYFEIPPDLRAGCQPSSDHQGIANPTFAFELVSNHLDEVVPIMDSWRREHEYERQNLQLAFLDDCAGSKALSEATTPPILIFLWELSPAGWNRVGFAGALIARGRRGGRCELQRLYVIPPMRRRGAGHLLLSALRTVAMSRNATTLSLSAGLRHQKASFTFWHSLGHRQDGEHLLDLVHSLDDLEHVLPPPPPPLPAGYTGAATSELTSSSAVETDTKPEPFVALPDLRAGGLCERLANPNRPSAPSSPEAPVTSPPPMPNGPSGASLLQRLARAIAPPPAPVEAPRELPPEQSSPQRPTAQRPWRQPLNMTTPKARILGNLLMPRAAPARATPSRLSLASSHYARIRARALAVGDGDMALRANVVDLMAVGEAVQESVDYGVNSNTAAKDDRAWLFWETVCEALGTSPLRTAEDVRDYPQKQAHLLAVLLMYAFAVCVPVDRSREFVKPRSALAYPLAIIRIFGRWGIVMPGYKSLIAAMNGLMRMYLAYHGPHSLAPKRAEPMKFSMMRSIYAVRDVRVGRWYWSDEDHDVFMFRRLNVVLMFTAFRLAEIVSHSSGEIMFITRACLLWNIHGMVVAYPTIAQLSALRPGLDYALVAPPRSKPDQWGEIHCPFPVTLTYDDEPDNPAAQLRDIEIRCPCPNAERASRPLFADAQGQPYTHGFLAGMLYAILLHLYGPAVAALYTFHSYRSGLATALHAAGVPDPTIQLICRWMCPESLHVYRRMGTREHEAHTRAASAATVDVLQAVNAPRVSGDHGYASLVSSLQGTRGRAAQRDYESTLAAARAAHPVPACPSSSAPAAHSPARRATPHRTPTREPTKRGVNLPLEPLTPPMPAAPPTLTTFTTRPPAGARVFVPRAIFPREVCNEHAGEGWAAEVVSSTRFTCTLAWLHARTPSGGKYENVRLRTDALFALE